MPEAYPQTEEIEAATETLIDAFDPQHLGPVDLITETAAIAAHEVTRCFDEIVRQKQKPSWEDLNHAERMGTVALVQLIHNGPTTLGPEMHALWLAVRKAQGWTYGPFEDPDRKVSPEIQPWESLPLRYRNSHEIFVMTARATLEHLLEPLTHAE